MAVTADGSIYYAVNWNLIGIVASVITVYLYSAII